MVMMMVMMVSHILSALAESLRYGFWVCFHYFNLFLSERNMYAFAALRFYFYDEL